MLFAAVIALLVVEIANGLLIAGLLAMLGVLYLIHSSVQEAGRRRTRTLDLMTATMRGSDNPRAALEGAAEIAPQPVAAELREVVRRLDLGMPIRRALLRLSSNYDCEGVRLFTSALATKWTVGGDLSPTLSAVNRVIRERLRHRQRVRSQLAGANVASWMVAICPYLAMAAMWYFNPDWLRRLFSFHLGPFLFFAAVGLQIVGFLWLRRMARVEL
jgi:tight adherence protein B